MSTYKIKDGTGTGRLALVTTDNRLGTDSISLPAYSYASQEKGDAFIVTTDFITFTTTATEMGFMYFKNTSNIPINIYSLRTCGLAAQQWKIIKNPTGGTLISNAVASPSNNLNLSSPKIVSTLSYVGVDGDTVTGGTLLDQFINAMGHSEEFFNGALVLSPLDSIALVIKLPAATTACARMIYYV